MFYLKITFILFSAVIFSTSTYGQTGDEKKISKEVWNLSTSKLDTDEMIKNGKKMLEVSRNDYDRAKSHGYIGDAQYKKGYYNEAVKQLEQADYYAEKSNFKSERFTINILLSLSYLKTGFELESNNSWKIANAIANNNKNRNQLVTVREVRAKNLEFENRYCEAIPYNLQAAKLREQYSPDYKNDIFVMNSYVKLSYDYLKCNNLTEARKWVKKADDFLKNHTEKDGAHYIEFYYMCKGIISAKEGNLQEAKAYFDKAEEVVDRKKDQRIKSMLYEERLLNAIDRDFSAKEKYYKKYLSLTNFKNEETKKLITQTIEKERKKTDDAQKTKIYLFSLVIILLLSIGIIVTVNKRKRRKNEQIFHEIIRNMEAEKAAVPAVHNKDEKSPPSKVKAIIKDENTEKKLLEKLNKFEKDHLYTTNGLTLTKMASVLNTNTTYLTYILKTHRNSDFNSYLNKKRISYIISKIKEDPKYSTYKISYLAEECGFSTHSQFGRVFRSETGLSPSEFIAFMKKSDQ